MRVAGTLLAVTLIVLIAAPASPAGVLPAWSLGNLAVGASSQSASSSSPSPLGQLASGTKKFFSGVQNAMTPKSQTKKTSTTRYYTPGTASKAKTTQQKSWFTSLLHPGQSNQK